MTQSPGLRPILLATCALIAAGCGGAKHAAPPPGRPCPIDIGEVRAESGIHDLKRLDLTPPAAVALRCSTSFVGPGGELVVSVTEADGGTARLARVRAERANAREPARAVHGLGDEAVLVGRRLLAVRFGKVVVTVESGITPSGRTLLAPAQLRALARALAK